MKWVLCIFICLLSVPLFASVQVRICDPNTFEAINLTEVMVGSRISLVVNSDANDFWSGGLFIEGQDRAIGRLQAKDKDPNSRDWSGSHFGSSGEGAYVIGWKDSMMWGFDLYPDNFERESGNWFVIDYYAQDEGSCNVGFYDHSYSWTIPDPNVSLTFLNTPTRDLHSDGFVNYADFVVFSSYWQAENCADPNNSCYQADFSRNGSVGLEDVVMFADFWLYGNPGWKPAETSTTTTTTAYVAEPNIVYDVTYAIVDVNSLSEITLEVGQSVVLYIVKSSTYEDTYVFNTEVNISDPNLGSIDNSFFGTAEILATPRSDMFDYIGPGSNQSDGIEFFAASLGAIMLDGDMASFVYTATEPGDVTLNLMNYSSGAKLEPIIIHQFESVVEKLQQIYEESPTLQEKIPEPEWNEFIESVEQSESN